MLIQNLDLAPLLVGGLEMFGTMEFYDFPFSWEGHNPNWRTHSYFSEGLKPPTSLDIFSDTEVSTGIIFVYC